MGSIQGKYIETETTRGYETLGILGSLMVQFSSNKQRLIDSFIHSCSYLTKVFACSWALHQEEKERKQKEKGWVKIMLHQQLANS
jgi:hypothetical protein